MRRALSLILLLAGCSGSPSDPPADASPAPAGDPATPGATRSDLSPAEQAQRLLVQALAHHDMRAWAESGARFAELAALLPGEPAAGFGSAVVAFHTPDHAAAEAHLASLDTSDADLRSRIAFLRSRLAYERGDVAGQLAHLVEASAARPDDGAMALITAELARTVPEQAEVEAEHLTRARAALPDNLRVKVAYVRWARAQGDASLSPAIDAELSALAAFIEGEAPEAAPAILNTVRASRRYRQDAARIDDATRIEPLRRLRTVPAPPAPTPRSVAWTSTPLEGVPGDGPLVAAAELQTMPSDVATARPPSRVAFLRGGVVSVGPTGGAAKEVATFADGRRLIALDADADPEWELLVEHGGGVTLLDPAGDVWTATAVAPAAPPLRDLLVLDWESDADHDLLLVSADGGLLLSTQGAGFGAPAPLDLRVSDARRVFARDLDGDHDVDLLVSSARGVAWFDNLRQGDYAPAGSGTQHLAPDLDVGLDLDLDGDADPLPALPEGATGAVPVDLDGDADLDLVLLGVPPTALTNGLPADVPRISASIRQPASKGPSDLRGVVVRVHHGTTVDVLHPERPNVVLGFGARPSLLVATWPNGVSQYVFDPEPGRHYDLLLPTKLEGSCPFLYAHDGERYRFVTDLLGVSPVGLALAPGVYAPADPDEYLRLPDWVATDDTVRLRFTEELREVTYLDAFELIAVQHPEGTVAHSYEKWTIPFVEGFDLRFTDAPVPPVRVLQGDVDVTDVVRAQDARFVGGTPHPRWQGAAEPWTLTVELPPEIAAADEPVLLLTGWLQWGNTSTNIARAQAGERGMFPVLEVPSGDGWVAADVNVGLPAGKTKPVFVSLKGALNPEDPRLRLTTDFAVYWDAVALARGVSVDPTITRVPAGSAALQPGGFSRMYRDAPNGPHLFDYTDRTPYPTRPTPSGERRAVVWSPLQGLRTAFGPVERLLATVDDRSVVFGDGEELDLVFDVAGVERGPRTTWFIYSHGWAKDGDPNVAFSQTSEPLAWSGMGPDPYADPGPPAQLLEDLKATSLTRFVGPGDLAVRAAR